MRTAPSNTHKGHQRDIDCRILENCDESILSLVVKSNSSAWLPFSTFAFVLYTLFSRSLHQLTCILFTHSRTDLSQSFCYFPQSSSSNMKFANILEIAGAAGAYTVTVVDKFTYKNIDPVVIPGQYASHMHTFFGSDAVTLNTTTSKELQAGCATAVNPNDYSSYCKSSSVEEISSSSY